MTISTLVAFGHEGKGVNLDSSTHFSKLQEVFISGWRSDMRRIKCASFFSFGKRELDNKNHIYFHLTSTLINSILILILLKSHEYIIDKFIDNLFFVRVEENFYSMYLTSLFLFSWLFTFTIYKFKNYRKHFVVFLFSLFCFLSLLIFYDMINSFQNEIEYYDNLLDYCFKRSYYILIKEETLIATILIAFSVYVSQMIVGKKLLPTVYKRH